MVLHYSCSAQSFNMMLFTCTCMCWHTATQMNVSGCTVIITNSSWKGGKCYRSVNAVAISLMQSLCQWWLDTSYTAKDACLPTQPLQSSCRHAHIKVLHHNTSTTSIQKSCNTQGCTKHSVCILLGQNSNLNNVFAFGQIVLSNVDHMRIIRSSTEGMTVCPDSE